MINIIVRYAGMRHSICAIQGDIRLVTEATISGAEEAVQNGLQPDWNHSAFGPADEIAEDAGLIKMLAN